MGPQRVFPEENFLDWSQDKKLTLKQCGNLAKGQFKYFGIESGGRGCFGGNDKTKFMNKSSKCVSNKGIKVGDDLDKSVAIYQMPQEANPSPEPEAPSHQPTAIPHELHD